VVSARHQLRDDLRRAAVALAGQADAHKAPEGDLVEGPGAGVGLAQQPFGVPGELADGLGVDDVGTPAKVHGSSGRGVLGCHVGACHSRRSSSALVCAMRARSAVLTGS
jgi:hypothetical protein